MNLSTDYHGDRQFLDKIIVACDGLSPLYMACIVKHDTSLSLIRECDAALLGKGMDKVNVSTSSHQTYTNTVKVTDPLKE